MLESGANHQPGYDRMVRVREALGLPHDLELEWSVTPVPPLEATSLATVGACLAAAGEVSYGDLALATGLEFSALRRTVRDLHHELARLGMRVIDSGHRIRLSPASNMAAVARQVATANHGEFTQEQLVVIAITGAHGMITRRRIEEIRGADSEEIIAGLVERGYLEADIDERSPGRPRVYRLTTTTIAEIGMDSLEQLQEMLRQKIEG